MVKSVTCGSLILLALGVLAQGCNDSDRDKTPYALPAGFQVSTTSLPTAVINIPFSATLQTQNGQAPYTWAVISNSPAAGVSLAQDGVLSGTPTQAGNFPFRVRVTDDDGKQAERDLICSVAAAPVEWNPGSPFNPGTVGAAYGGNLNQSVTGGTSPITFEVVSGALPPGVNLDTNTGALTGTPTQAGNFSVSIRATSAADPATGGRSQAEKGTFFLVN